MDQNPPTSTAVQAPEQIQPNPPRNDDVSDIESSNPMSGNPQQGMPYFAGNPSQVVPREAPTSGCNGPCCISLQTACLVIGILGINLLILEIVGTVSITEKGIYPPLLLIATGVASKSINHDTTFFIILFVLFIINVILIVGSKKKLFVLVIIYTIATGVYVLTALIVFSIASHHPEIYFYYLYMLIYICFVVVAGFYCKELKTGQTQRQGQVYMPQGQGQVYMQQGQGQVLGTLGQNQISRSPSQANVESGQVIGSPGEAVGSPKQGQEYGQSN